MRLHPLRFFPIGRYKSARLRHKPCMAFCHAYLKLLKETALQATFQHDGDISLRMWPNCTFASGTDATPDVVQQIRSHFMQCILHAA